MSESSKQNSPNKVLRFLIILFFFCLVAFGCLGLKLVQQLSKEMVGEPNPSLGSTRVIYYDLLFFVNQQAILRPNTLATETAFIVETNQPVDDVLKNLASEGLISDIGLFRTMLIYTGADQKILPGKYLLPAGSTMRDVAFTLQDANASLVDFVILPGWRKEEIAEALPTSGLSITMEDFLSRVNQPIADPDLAEPGMVSYEGYLTPGRYSFRRDITREQFIGAFTRHFKQVVTKEMRDAFEIQGLSQYQAVILASIIQREAVIDSEKPMIASVFINRLNLGMQLQTDPTVQYALGFNPEWGWWKSPLSLQDLQVDSVYNTYKINGLPPAPISNPDETSLRAVAFPEKSTYLYFRAACDNTGQHKFSETIEEHTMNGCSNSGS
jgi:UPF0755 protein